MNAQSHFRSRPGIMIALGMILLAVHGLVFYFVRHHLSLSATLAPGIAVFLVIKHMGVFSSLYALVRKRIGRH